MGGVFSTTTQNPSDTPNSNFSSSSEFQKPNLTSSHKKSEISNQSDSSTQSLESEPTKTLESDSESAKTLDSESSKTLDSESSKTLDSESSKTLDSESKNVPETEEEEEEEEGECGLCLYMKGGDCKDAFIAWENCGDEAKKKNEDFAEKCLEFTGSLLKCMEAHSDYYGPFLNSMKAAEEVALKELEKESGSIDSEQTGISKDPKQND